jgi:thymidylate synthase ThyX
MAEKLLSGPPIIKSVKSLSNKPLLATESAAKTCYQSKLVSEDFLERKEAKGTLDRANTDRLIGELYDAGHHTTFEHNIFKFEIENVSRQLIWSFLHSHPFYNSEQQSQRFAPINTDSFITPDMPQDQLKLFQETAQLEINTFHKLEELLFPMAQAEYFSRFPNKAKNPDENKGIIGKKAQEAARYILPINMPSALHHTINEMTLLRLNRMSDLFDIPLEQKILVEEMLNSLEQNGIELGSIVEDQIPIEQTPEYEMMQQLHNGTETTAEFFTEFDEFLGNKRSRLEGHYENAEGLLSNIVRGIMGLPTSSMSDNDAIAAILDPTNNMYHSEKMNVNAHSKLMRALHEINYTFRKKLSHTADSQSQRHRTMPGAYPIFGLHLGETPDVITPELIKSVPEAETLYNETNEKVWENMGKLIADGIPVEDAAYLAPNGKAIRKWESGSLYGLLHKQIKRLCYNAQEEIWNITKDEAAEISRVHPEIGKYFGAPCDLRSEGKVTPYCPEGPRYCGVPVWKLDSSERKRLI